MAPSPDFVVALHAHTRSKNSQSAMLVLIYYLADNPEKKNNTQKQTKKHPKKQKHHQNHACYQPINSTVRLCFGVCHKRELLILTNDVGDHYAWNIVSNYSQNQAA